MDIKEIEEWQNGIIPTEAVTYSVTIEEYWKACKYVDFLLSRIHQLESQLMKIKSDPNIGKLEVQEWPETPND